MSRHLIYPVLSCDLSSWNGKIPSADVVRMFLYLYVNECDCVCVCVGGCVRVCACISILCFLRYVHLCDMHFCFKAHLCGSSGFHQNVCVHACVCASTCLYMCVQVYRYLSISFYVLYNLYSKLITSVCHCCSVMSNYRLTQL